MLVSFVAAAFLALLMLPPWLPPLLTQAMPSQPPVAMLIIPVACVVAAAGAAVAAPSPSPFVSLAMACIPRRSFSSQARDAVSRLALHNEWGRGGPREWGDAAVGGASRCARLSGHSCGDPRRRGGKSRSILSCGWCLPLQRKPQQQQEQQQQQQGCERDFYGGCACTR